MNIFKILNKATNKNHTVHLDNNVKTTTRIRTTSRPPENKVNNTTATQKPKHNPDNNLVYHFYSTKLAESIFVFVCTGLIMECPVLKSVAKEHILCSFTFLTISTILLTMVRDHPKLQQLPCFCLYKLVNFAFVTSTYILFGVYGPKLYSRFRPCFVVSAAALATPFYNYPSTFALAIIVGRHNKRIGFWMQAFIMPTIAIGLIQLMYLMDVDSKGIFKRFDYTDAIANGIFTVSLSLVFPILSIVEFKKFASSEEAASIKKDFAPKLPLDSQLKEKKQGIESV